MPNWCIAEVTITSEKAELIHKEIMHATDGRYESVSNSDFGGNWLGNLLLHIGYDKDDVVYGDIRCRGWIDDFELGKNEVRIRTQSAWGPHVLCIEKFAKNYDKNAEVIYTAEEFGCALYWTNDSSYANTMCYVDTNAGCFHDEYYQFESDIYEISQIEEILKEMFPNSNTLQDSIDEYNDILSTKDCFFSVNKYEFVEIGDGC